MLVCSLQSVCVCTQIASTKRFDDTFVRHCAKFLGSLCRLVREVACRWDQVSACDPRSYFSSIARLDLDSPVVAPGKSTEELRDLQHST